MKIIFISSFHHKKFKMSQARKVVTVKYTHEEEFLVPKGLDLEDETQVDNWYVEWNVLHIIKADGTRLQIRAGGLTADYEYDFPVCNSEKIIDSEMSECYNDIDDDEEAKIQTLEDLKNATEKEQERFAEKLVEKIMSAKEEDEEDDETKMLTIEDIEKSSYGKRQEFAEDRYPDEIVIEMICYVQSFYMERYGYDPLESEDSIRAIANMYCELRWFEEINKR